MFKKLVKKLTQFCVTQFVEIIFEVAFLSTLIPLVSTTTWFPLTQFICYRHVGGGIHISWGAPLMWILLNLLFFLGAKVGIMRLLGVHCLVYNVSLESRQKSSLSLWFSILFIPRKRMTWKYKCYSRKYLQPFVLVTLGTRQDILLSLPYGAKSSQINRYPVLPMMSWNTMDGRILQDKS